MDPLLGVIVLLPYQFAPSGWLFCEGQMLPVERHHALFSLLGTTFGGNGTTTFGLPDLKGKEPVAGLRYYIAVEGIYPSRP